MPSHPWQADRIAEEGILMKKYGLKNKHEIWKATSKLRNWREQARNLIALPEETRAKVGTPLFTKLRTLGLLQDKASIDDILGLKVEQVLDNRLQTQVHKKGMASTVKQARQFIVHQKVFVDGKVITAPSYSVTVQNKIELAPGFKPVKAVVKKIEPVVVVEQEPGEFVNPAEPVEEV